MKAVIKDEKLRNYLSTHQIAWQFNLSRAPGWGGQFERMIGLFKAALNKRKCFFTMEGVGGRATRCRGGVEQSTTKLCGGRPAVSSFNS